MRLSVLTFLFFALLLFNSDGILFAQVSSHESFFTEKDLEEITEYLVAIQKTNRSQERYPYYYIHENYGKRDAKRCFLERCVLELILQPFEYFLGLDCDNWQEQRKTKEEIVEEAAYKYTFNKDVFTARIWVYPDSERRLYFKGNLPSEEDMVTTVFLENNRGEWIRPKSVIRSPSFATIWDDKIVYMCKFPKKLPSGKELITEGTQFVKLVVTGLLPELAGEEKIEATHRLPFSYPPLPQKLKDLRDLAIEEARSKKEKYWPLKTLQLEFFKSQENEIKTQIKESEKVLKITNEMSEKSLSPERRKQRSLAKEKLEKRLEELKASLSELRTKTEKLEKEIQ